MQFLQNKVIKLHSPRRSPRESLINKRTNQNKGVLINNDLIFEHDNSSRLNCSTQQKKQYKPQLFRMRKKSITGGNNTELHGLKSLYGRANHSNLNS